MTQLTATCKICGANLTIPEGTEISEIISCNECQTRLVVQRIETNDFILGEAPKVEEDWGE